MDDEEPDWADDIGQRVHSQLIETERALAYEEGYMDCITGRVRKYMEVPDVSYGQYLRGWRDAGGTL